MKIEKNLGTKSGGKFLRGLKRKFEIFIKTKNIFNLIINGCKYIKYKQLRKNNI